MFGWFKKLFCKKEIIPTSQSSNSELALKVIKKAKENLAYYGFMCPSMLNAYHSEVNGNGSMYDIEELIPEFNPEFLGGKKGFFWWDTIDKESRIKAFDKLIKIYSKKV